MYKEGISKNFPKNFSYFLLLWHNSWATLIPFETTTNPTAKIPIIYSVGEREKNNRTVSIRRLGSKKTESLSIDEAISSVLNQIG